MSGEQRRGLGVPKWAMFLAVCLPLSALLRPQFGFGWSIAASLLVTLAFVAALLLAAQVFARGRQERAWAMVTDSDQSTPRAGSDRLLLGIVAGAAFAVLIAGAIESRFGFVWALLTAAGVGLASGGAAVALQRQVARRAQRSRQDEDA